LLRSAAGVADVVDGEVLDGADVALQVVGEGLVLGRSGVLGELQHPIGEVPPEPRQFLGGADREAFDGLAAALVGIEPLAGQAGPLGRLHGLGVGGVFVAREALGDHHGGLRLGDGPFALDGDGALRRSSAQRPARLEEVLADPHGRARRDAARAGRGDFSGLVFGHEGSLSRVDGEGFAVRRNHGDEAL
jgi:hypothetical protein